MGGSAATSGIDFALIAHRCCERTCEYALNEPVLLFRPAFSARVDGEGIYFDADAYVVLALAPHRGKGKVPECTWRLWCHVSLHECFPTRSYLLCCVCSKAIQIRVPTKTRSQEAYMIAYGGGGKGKNAIVQ